MTRETRVPQYLCLLAHRNCGHRGRDHNLLYVQNGLSVSPKAVYNERRSIEFRVKLITSRVRQPQSTDSLLCLLDVCLRMS
jgi:hypothetical protein